ncbi:MAG: DNA replication and repair protein RecF [Treponema sp.]|jgi:DNA replication and repair protein RecF|nr:DNA replication and repair protein RecF [Treponema sp.]
MIFKGLQVASFRNLADAELDIREKDVFLVGENGQGKTNFLEALYFCAYGSSFRGVRDSELIRLGEPGCSVAAQFGGSLYEKALITLEKGKKTIVLDGKPVHDRKTLLSVVPCIVFCHEDMEFVAGTPERRRWFFDQTQSLYDPVYLEDLRAYRKVLKTRNTVLKDRWGTLNHEVIPILEALDAQIVHYGLRLMEQRKEAAQSFSAAFRPLYEAVSGINHVHVQYAPSWKATTADTVIAFLQTRWEADIAAGTTLSGPHRDHYHFTQGEREFAGKASTGQRRLLALLLRIAQARRFSEMTGKAPVLLLDDVLLELDGEKRRKFLQVMPEYDQAFYTFLPEEPFEGYRQTNTLVYHVAQGSLSASKHPRESTGS